MTFTNSVQTDSLFDYIQQIRPKTHLNKDVQSNVSESLTCKCEGNKHPVQRGALERSK